jgi:glucokinase
MDRNSRVIGIDISGTFGSGIRGAVVDGNASLVARKEAITPRTEEDLIGALVTMANRLVDLARQDGSPAAALGIAVPGLIDEAAGVVHRSPNLTLKEVALGSILEERVKLPTFLIHDAGAGALGEYSVGVGRGVSDMMLVVMGLGVGSAVISGGRILRGAHGTVGEIGHISIDPTGIICGCGGRGCIETFASETAIARRYTMAAKQAILAEEVIAKASAGDPVAARIWNEALGALATVIATAVALIDCELVVLSGTMQITTGALVPLGTLLSKRINLVQLPRVEVGALGDTAGLLGAAAIAFERARIGDATHEWRQLSRTPPSRA